MTRFSVVFGLANAQAALDFVDVDLATDTPLYVIHMRSRYVMTSGLRNVVTPSDHSSPKC